MQLQGRFRMTYYRRVVVVANDRRKRKKEMIKLFNDQNQDSIESSSLSNL